MLTSPPPSSSCAVAHNQIAERERKRERASKEQTLNWWTFNFSENIFIVYCRFAVILLFALQLPLSLVPVHEWTSENERMALEYLESEVEYPFCALVYFCHFCHFHYFVHSRAYARMCVCVFDFAYFITAEKLWRRRRQHRASLLVVWLASIKSELWLSSSMFNSATSFITIDIVISLSAGTAAALHGECGLCWVGSAICL